MRPVRGGKSGTISSVIVTWSNLSVKVSGRQAEGYFVVRCTMAKVGKSVKPSPTYSLLLSISSLRKRVLQFFKSFLEI